MAGYQDNRWQNAQSTPNIHVAGVPHSGNRYTCVILHEYGLHPMIQHCSGHIDQTRRVVPTRPPLDVLRSSWTRLDREKRKSSEQFEKLVALVLFRYVKLRDWTKQNGGDYIQFKVGEHTPAYLAEQLGVKGSEPEVPPIGHGEARDYVDLPTDFVMPEEFKKHAEIWGYA